MRLNFTNAQIILLVRLCPDINLDGDISDDMYFTLDDAVADCLAVEGIVDNEVNEVGRLCESILDILSEQE